MLLVSMMPISLIMVAVSRFPSVSAVTAVMKKRTFLMATILAVVDGGLAVKLGLEKSDIDEAAVLRMMKWD